MTWLLAHGIGGIRDLPVPRFVFFYGAAGVLVVSFAALAFLWRKPVLAARRDGRPLPAGLQRVLLSRGLRVAVGTLMVALLVFLWLGALVGSNSSGVFVRAMSNARPIVCIGTSVVALTFEVRSASWYSLCLTRLVTSTGPDVTREATRSTHPIVAGRAER